MELLLGFAIAVLIAITGVGAGSLIAPLLILFLHVPVAEAVGTALAYSAAVKLVVVPVQIWRRQIEWRTLAIILATGIPGVAIGSLIFQRVAHNSGKQSLALPGARPHDRRLFRLAHLPPLPARRRTRAAHQLARSGSPLVMLPIGAEVGFSSSGAGALGTLALLGLTPLDARRIVGTDLAFGLCLSLVGGTLHLHSAGLNSTLLINLIVGGVLGAPRRHRPRLAHPRPHHAPRALPLALRHGPSALLARAGHEPSFIPQTSVYAPQMLPRSSRIPGDILHLASALYASFPFASENLPWRVNCIRHVWQARRASLNRPSVTTSISFSTIWRAFPFISGQFISAVAPDPNGKQQTRAYSIASAANANHFELCVNRVPQGFFSNHLADLTDLPPGGIDQGSRPARPLRSEAARHRLHLHLHRHRHRSHARLRAVALS